MDAFKKMFEEWGLTSRKKKLRGPDRRKRSRRYERVTDGKYSPEYQGRVKKDRRKGDRRK